MESWLFQANPKFYKARQALQHFKATSHPTTWLVNAHKGHIKAGDEVFFWEAGPQAGLVGWGTIQAGPTKLPGAAAFGLKAAGFDLPLPFPAPSPILFAFSLDKEFPPAYSIAWVIMRLKPENASILAGVFAFGKLVFRPKSSIRNTYETNRIFLSLGANNSFRINTYVPPASVASKGLTGKLTRLDATLTKKPGEGARCSPCSLSPRSLC